MVPDRPLAKASSSAAPIVPIRFPLDALPGTGIVVFPSGLFLPNASSEPRAAFHNLFPEPRQDR